MQELVLSRRAPDPLPAKILVVAFPTAFLQMRSASAFAQVQDFFLVQAPCDQIEIEQQQIDWLTLSPPVAIAATLSRVNYRAQNNTLLARTIFAPITVYRKHYAVEFNQQAGFLVQDEMVRVLNSPLTIDFLIAITFIADKIKKLQPPPVKLIVTIIAMLAIIALGFVIAAVRRAFVDVPEPLPLSTDTNGVPIVIVPNVVVDFLPLPNVPAEDQTIALQTVKQLYWLIRQIIE